MLKNKKLNFGILFAFFLFIPGLLHGANTPKIDLDLNNVTLKEFFSAIEKQSDYTFMFNNIDINQTVSIQAKQTDLNNILKSVLTPKGITYEIVSKRIILNANAGNNVARAKSEPSAKIVITGVVTDEKGEPVIGANVIEKGTTNGTVTDVDGRFTLEVNSNAVIRVSYIGYDNQDINTTGKTSFNIVLTEASQVLGEVVAIGYGVQRKASLTAAVTNMTTDQITKIPTSNLSNVLAGRLSGTFINSSTGTPGIASNIKVRGIASWNGGSPIYVIDGVVRDRRSFDMLDPNEVADITVLKDAASAAIYGSRSANGVILVNTKKGSSGKIKVEYSSVFGTEKTGKLPEYMDMRDGLKLWQTVLGGISDEEINWVLKENPGGMKMYNAAYQDPTSQKHSLNASGGTDRLTYFIGGSYFDEKGFLPNVTYKKYNLRANVSVDITKNLKVGLNLSNSYGTRKRFNFTYDWGSDDLSNLWGKLLYWDVFFPVYMEDGRPLNPGWLGNPVEMMKNGGYWRNNNQQIDALADVEYKVPLVKGLALKAFYSRNMNNSYVKDFAQKQLLYDVKRRGDNNLIYTDEVVGPVMSGDPGTEYIGNEYSKSDAYQLNFQINFDRSFGEHHINAMAAYEQYEYQGNYFAMYRYNFPLFPKDQFFAASKNNSDWDTDGNESQDGRLSYIGRINYEYKGRYLFSTSVRRDGSIKFAPAQRWGWFPSVSAGYLISEEDFYKRSKLNDYIEMLKLRFSFGSTGNDAIGGWKWLDQYNIRSSSYYLGNPGIASPRLSYGGIPNADLTWEKSNSYNLGIDMNFLRHFNFTAELWKRYTFDALGSRILVLPSEFGGSLPATNYGKVNTQGFELELGYNNRVSKDFDFGIKANFGLATSEVILKDYAANAQDVDNPIGKTMSYGTGYQATGIIRTQGELDKLPDNYLIFGAAPELGMMNFADLSGPDKKPDGKIDGYDRIILGNYMGSGNAPISFGLFLNANYKGFTVEALFSGLAGFKTTYNDAWGRNYGGGGKVPFYHADSWSTDNPNGSTPKLYPWGDTRANGYTQTSTFNTYDGDFIRLKNLNIGYNVPSRLYAKTGISNIQLFITGNNLFYWSKFKFYDPEIAGFMSYPIMKSYSAGLNIQF